MGWLVLAVLVACLFLPDDGREDAKFEMLDRLGAWWVLR